MRASVCVFVLLLPTLALTANSSASSRVAVAPPHRLPAATSYAQQHGNHAPGTETARLPVAVDGSVSPDLISDELAYAHFLRAMAGSATGAARQVALTRAGLAPADRAAFVAALGTLGQELAAVAQQRRAVGPSMSAAAHEQLKRREDDAVLGARLRVDVALSAAGQARLDAHIRNHVKRRIKIYRAPMPAPAPGGPVR